MYHGLINVSRHLPGSGSGQVGRGQEIAALPLEIFVLLSSFQMAPHPLQVLWHPHLKRNSVHCSLVGLLYIVNSC